MASETSDKLWDLAQFCMKNEIGLEFIDHGPEGNLMEDTMVDGKRCIRLEVGGADTQEYKDNFNEFVNSIIE